MNAVVHGCNHALSFEGIKDLCSPMIALDFGVIHFNLKFVSNMHSIIEISIQLNKYSY